MQVVCKHRNRALAHTVTRIDDISRFWVLRRRRSGINDVNTSQRFKIMEAVHLAGINVCRDTDVAVPLQRHLTLLVCKPIISL